MAGPVDTRVNPNRINSMAERRSLSLYERFLTTEVPAQYPGAGRRVYPGAAQLTAFMSLNVRRHVTAHVDLCRALAAGDEETSARIRDFYDEYGAVMDVPAEFYLETLQRIFMDHDLPRGEFTWRGERVDPSDIRATALLTVEARRTTCARPVRPRQRTDCARRSRRSGSVTTCRRAWGTTASSRARAGKVGSSGTPGLHRGAPMPASRTGPVRGVAPPARRQWRRLRGRTRRRRRWDPAAPGRTGVPTLDDVEPGVRDSPRHHPCVDQRDDRVVVPSQDQCGLPQGVQPRQAAPAADGVELCPGSR